MRTRRLVVVVLLMWGSLLLSPPVEGKERLKLPPDIPEHRIIYLNPAEVDPSFLPLDSIEQLGITGVPPSDFQVEQWKLVITGKKVEEPESFTYQELLTLSMVKKRVLLICPGFFADYAEWEGIPLQELLRQVKMEGTYETISVQALDGYTVNFSREEVENHFLLFAVKVNGETLPLEHGFPVRLVAEDLFGSHWVKWITTVSVD